MKTDRKTVFIALGTLVVGLLLGALFFGGGGHSASSPELATEEHSHPESGLWTCSMHPQVRQSEPGSCPFCGMDLIPVSEGGNDDNPRVLKMSNAAQALADIRTEVVGRSEASASLSINGRIKADERRVQTQTTHFGGRIEKLYKNFEGEYVKKGEKVASIYSPQLVAAQNELLEAKKLASTNPALLEAARKKLKYWKITDEQIAAIEASGEAMRNIDLLSNYEGIILKKLVNNGDHLMEGGALYQIADLTTVWAIFEVYEKDLGKVKLGDKVTFSPNGINQNFEATINFIAPSVESNSRIIEVRADVPNGNGRLKPDMFIKAQIKAVASNELSIPRSAVLWTGKRSVVYVKLANNEGFELREVELGNAIDNHYQVIEGLKAGEEVVVNGTFTLDAEAQLKGKISMMAPSESSASDHKNGFQEIELPGTINYIESTPRSFKNQLQSLTKTYLTLKDAMVEGLPSSIQVQSQKVSEALKKTDMSLLKGDAHMHWMTLLEPMQQSLSDINSSDNRDQQRLQFINLSKALINAIESFGTTMESPLYVQFCPMANNDKGATWVSAQEEIINPYFGDMMLRCGNVEYTIENNPN